MLESFLFFSNINVVEYHRGEVVDWKLADKCRGGYLVGIVC